MRNSIPVILLVFFCVACTALKGYPGPEQHSSKLALVIFRGAEQVSLSRMQVNEHSHGMFDAGIQVFPGVHSASFISEVPQDLCWLGDGTACPVATSTFNCAINFEVEAGNSYIIEARGYARQASVWVIRELDLRVIAQQSCEQRSLLELGGGEAEQPSGITL
jgi:hypothetical protein